MLIRYMIKLENITIIPIIFGVIIETITQTFAQNYSFKINNFNI